LSDAQSDLRLTQLLERLREDRLNVAFVAEFSRGKSELINAIFFADYGNRMLPSSAGRTTMCPTELMFDANKQPSIELLPIQTRASNSSVSEYKRFPDEWTKVALNTESPDAMQDALRHVSETTRVTPEEAARLGFEVGEGQIELYSVGDDGLVEVPRWRHAMINFRIPCSSRGWSFSTPRPQCHRCRAGTDAVAAAQCPCRAVHPGCRYRCHAVRHGNLARAYLRRWHGQAGPHGRAEQDRRPVGRTENRSGNRRRDPAPGRNQRRRAGTAGQPGFPVSAQKGLVAKINGDATLLERSRLPQLEAALSKELIPAKRDIVCDSTQSEFGDVSQRVRGLLESRLTGLREQLTELTELRGKNKGVVEYMMGKVRAEKDEFESGLQRYYAVRSVFSTLTNNLFGHLGLDVLRQLTHETRTVMLDAAFSKTLSDAMANFFARSREALSKSNGEIAKSWP
jgi:hypothetical protein